MPPFHTLTFSCQRSFCNFLKNFGGILTKINPKNQQNCQKPVFTVELPTIFNFKKVPKLASFRVKLVNFLSEKGRFSFLLRSLHFGSNRLIQIRIRTLYIPLYYTTLVCLEYQLISNLCLQVRSI